MDNVFEYIKSESTAFKTRTITLADGWEWNMYEHIRKSFLYKNSKFTEGANDGSRPFNNIILPILMVAYRSEGFDVKDIVPYVNDEKNYYKSFLVKKYHPKWARRNDIDTFIDDLVESYVDYGLALTKEIDEVRPEVVPLEKLAFCDQTDVLSGAICIEHQYTPAELKAQTKWDQDEIAKAIRNLKTKSRSKDTNLSTSNKESDTPTHYIRVYELHGEFPESWLKDDGDEDTYVRQMQIVVLDSEKEKSGMVLFKGKEKSPFNALKRDKIFGRACGRGGIEDLFDAQVWYNYDAIQVKEMLDQASLMVTVTADKSLAQRQKITDLEKGEMLYESMDARGTTRQLLIQPYNKQHFDNNAEKWEERARLIGAASEGQLGITPASGTPLGTTQIVTSQGIGPHEYRQGKIATFVAELYRDRFLKELVKDMNKGQKFLDELSLDEMQEVADKVKHYMANKEIVNLIVNKDQRPTPQDQEIITQASKESFLKSGNKKFIEIIKDELKDIPTDVEVNIAGKQKDMVGMVNKLSNIIRTFIADPRFQTPDLANMLLELMEDSGLSPINFSSVGKVFSNPPATQTPQTPQMPAQHVPSPLQANQPVNA